MKLLPRKPGFHTLGAPFRLLPESLTNAPLTRVINHLFHEPIEEGDFDFLEDRCLKIHITDLEVSFYVSFNGEQLLAGEPRHHDVEFRGNARAFLLLASRQEDPDTLFFQRSLMIEGDTELGLGVKNLLDSLDLEELLPERLHKIAVVGQKIHRKMPAFSH
ncbi:hypothetical protein ACH42_11360 [Endozoicomonas sp. (ex Bugula neritina AB1)]|nr:hypothetical protein ACH42_11360 [Endozoicomonas sp. (ex Bugula neritina AB1)]